MNGHRGDDDAAEPAGLAEVARNEVLGHQHLHKARKQ